MIRIVCLFFALLYSINIYATVNEKPFVIPEIRDWQGREGRINLLNDIGSVKMSNDSLEFVVTQFLSDIESVAGAEFKYKKGRGCIIFNIIQDDELGDEGYKIDIQNDVSCEILIEANAIQGLYWATQTLLQILEQSSDRAIPCGVIRDYPDYPLRGYMLDCARKFIPIDFLKDYIRIMSYYKMNTLQIHLNDNGMSKYFGNNWENTYSAFRLESDVFPGLAAKDGHYTKAEFIELQHFAKSYGVDIIPEIDVPAHSLAFTRYKPEIASQYGLNYLDLFKPETYEFLDLLFDEYLSGDEPVFVGNRVHIGTDEYQATTEQSVQERFRYFVDRYIRYVETYGKQACVWGSLSASAGVTEVKAEDVVMNIWHSPFAEPVDMINDGYEIVNIPEINYIVPLGSYYNDYMDYRQIYETWTPATFGDDIFEERHPSILGGMFAVWNDVVGNGITVKDIHDRSFRALQTISAKCWASSYVTTQFADFEMQSMGIGEAPGVNVAGRVPGEDRLVYSEKRVRSNSEFALHEIGYDYSVSFDIECEAEDVGSVLFESDNATVYLSDPTDGEIGFSREGCSYSFGLSVQEGDKLNIVIMGDNHSTQLYVDGKLFSDLDIEVVQMGDDVSKNQIKTLVFPLARSGSFNSKITNLKVYNYKLF